MRSELVLAVPAKSYHEVDSKGHQPYRPYGPYEQYGGRYAWQAGTDDISHVDQVSNLE